MITQEQAIELFDYNPDTGAIYLRVPNRLGRRNGSLIDGYRYFKVLGLGPIPAHRVAWLIIYGDWLYLDHKNLNRLDNRINNLRPATHTQNMYNTPSRNNSRTGIKGISPCGGKFRVVIHKNYKQYYLGLFDTIEEAVKTHSKAAKQLYGEFAA